MAGLLTGLLVVLGAGSAQEVAGQAGGKKGDRGQESHYQHCAKACNDCEQICSACATHCAKLIAQGKKDHLKTLQTCQDCATHCAAAACITARQGPFADLICTACVEACKRCGDACAQYKDDPTMRRCAEECHRCEQACREMLRHTGRSGAQPGARKE
jgi:hypothetical protein